MTEHAEELGHNPSRLIADGRAAKEANRQRLGDVLTGRAQELPEADELAARIATMVAPVIDAAIDPTHDESLIGVVRQRLADRGANF